MSRKKTQSEVFIHLKTLRKKWGLIQEDMAIRVKIATSTYQYYERGERDTPSEVLYMLTTYGVNAEWLLTGEGEMTRGDDKEKYVDKKSSLYNKVGMSAMHVAAPGAEYNADMDDFGRAATGLKEIFDSGDPVLIPAIQANIHAFQISVRREAHIQEQTKEISDLKKRMESLEKQMKEGERRKGERRLKNLDPPNGLDRRSGAKRRKHAIGE